MTIYEIDSQILECIDEETGEVLDVERLEKLMQDKENKIEAVALWYKNTVAEADAIKAEIANLRARKEHDEKLAESLKIYLSNALGGQKFNTPKVSISYRKSSSVEVEDVYSLPAELLTFKPEPAKAEIKRLMLAGNEVSGAKLVKIFSCTYPTAWNKLAAENI